jgi:hypothetical protein
VSDPMSEEELWAELKDRRDEEARKQSEEED